MKFGQEYIDFSKNINHLDFTHKGEWQKKYAEMFRRVFVDHANGDSLDFGCAMGSNTSALNDAGFKMVGIDVSEEYKKQSPFKNVEIKVYDGKKLPFEDNHFTFIHSQQVMEHIPLADLVDHVLPEIFRVMKEGGIFYMATPGGAPKGIDPGDPTHVSCFYDNEWIELVTKAGFVNVTKDFAEKWSREPMFQEYKWHQFMFQKPVQVEPVPFVSVTAEVVEQKQAQVPVKKGRKSQIQK